MSTLANITSLNLTMQTGGAALAVKAAGRLVAPARTVYVYGTADDVAPNFTTVAGALTYANSLDADPVEPVVIRLFSKADGTPYDLTGLDPWIDYATSGVLFTSDFTRVNKSTILPSFLPAGLQVWYIDPNGVETLWVGREDGSAWPAVGYKEYLAFINDTAGDLVVTVQKNEFPSAVTTSRSAGGDYRFVSDTFTSFGVNKRSVNIGDNLFTSNATGITIKGRFISTQFQLLVRDAAGTYTEGTMTGTPISFKIYP